MPDPPPACFARLLVTRAFAFARAAIYETLLAGYEQCILKTWSNGVCWSMIVDSLLTIINYHTRGKTRKTIIDYHEEFEQGQNER